ncbi:CHAT domain-containing protein [Micromonospora sp. M12]
MAGVDLAHIAAHGQHQTENPLFSTLELAGGPLLGYDVQELRTAPRTVVLSCCDLGLTDVRHGDEALGMPTALLAAGTATVVASVSRVADETAMEIMVAYHRAVVAGRQPAAALAEAVRGNQPRALSASAPAEPTAPESCRQQVSRMPSGPHPGMTDHNVRKRRRRASLAAGLTVLALTAGLLVGCRKNGDAASGGAENRPGTANGLAKIAGGGCPAAGTRSGGLLPKLDEESFTSIENPACRTPTW